jgi:hypothetical protein
MKIIGQKLDTILFEMKLEKEIELIGDNHNGTKKRN